MKNYIATINSTAASQLSQLESDVTMALLQASGGMLASVVVMAIAIRYINRHFRNVMRGHR